MMRCNMGRSTYSDEVKARAVALARDHGPAQAARLLAADGITAKPGTIRSWASRAGVATVAATNTRAATEVRLATAAERRARLADRLLEIAEMASEHALATMGEARLSEVVGLFTRAIHDHQLLTGAATSRQEHASPDKAHGLVDELAARRAKTAAA